MRLTWLFPFAAGRGRGTSAAKKPPHPEGTEQETKSKQAVERSHIPDAEAGRAEASVPMDVETTPGVEADDIVAAAAEQPKGSAEGPTTLLEELLTLPAPEYEGLVADLAEGASSPRVSFKLTRDGACMHVRCLG